MSVSIVDLKRRAVLRPGLAMIVDAGGRDIGVTPGPWRCRPSGRAHWWRPAPAAHGRQSRSRDQLSSAHDLVDGIGREGFLEAAGAVVLERTKEGAVLVPPTPGDLEVIMDQFVGARVQRQIPGFLALAGDLDVRHAAARLPEILDFQLAQLLAPQRVQEQRRQDGAVALL